MAIRLVFGEEVVRVICAYVPPSGKPDLETLSGNGARVEYGERK